MGEQYRTTFELLDEALWLMRLGLHPDHDPAESTYRALLRSLSSTAGKGYGSKGEALALRLTRLEALAAVDPKEFRQEAAAALLWLQDQRGGS